MDLSYNRWRRLFLFSLGLFVGTGFCMKWMEADFWSGGEKFNIMGLELFYPKDKMIVLLGGLDSRVKTILQYHLYFDFAFMAGVYPGITSLCMMARQRAVSVPVKRILTLLAWLQLIAWAGDITENYYLLSWIHEPVVGNEFLFYHIVVAAKWILALAGAVLSIGVLLGSKKKSSIAKTHFFF